MNNVSPASRPLSRLGARAGSLLGIVVLAIGLIANEDSTQEWIHRALPWSDGGCRPWSLGWLAIGWLLAAISLSMTLRYEADGRFSKAAAMVARGTAASALIYWSINSVGAFATRCVP